MADETADRHSPASVRAGQSCHIAPRSRPPTRPHLDILPHSSSGTRVEWGKRERNRLGVTAPERACCQRGSDDPSESRRTDPNRDA